MRRAGKTTVSSYRAPSACWFEVCSHPGPVYMDLTEPVIPGVGTING